MSVDDKRGGTAAPPPGPAIPTTPAAAAAAKSLEPPAPPKPASTRSSESSVASAEAALPRAARPSRVLPWLAIVIGLLGLAAGVLAIAGPRAVALAERNLPSSPWTPALRQALNPGWSVDAAEFDRRVNVLEGVLGRAEPGGVSRESIVDLLQGRLDGRRANDLREAQSKLSQDIADLRSRLQEGSAQAEGRSAALGGRIDGLDQRIGSAEDAAKQRLDAADQSLAKTVAAIDELRTQIAGLAALGERVGKAETEAAAITKRLEETSAAMSKRSDEIAAGLDEIKRRAAGPERLLAAVLQLQISTQTGRPFANELRMARQIIGPDPALSPALESLTVAAQRGAPTVSDLRDQFGQVADAITERALRENRNWAERVGAGVKGTLASVGLSLPPAPTPVEAAVAETARQMANGNLRAALAEIETVSAPLKSLAAAWIAQAQLRIAVDQAVGDVTQVALDRASKAQ